jgi:DNA (cytosine-5)-methyltransferase 1
MVPVMALDFNQTALRVYEDNFPGVWLLSKPIETVLDGALGSPASVAERQVAARLGRVDVLVGGPPCQGHSNLNNHTRRQDPKNKLYDRMARLAELVEPMHVIIENVSAVLHDKGKVVDRTIAHLRRLGYSTDDAAIEAVTIGVPQRRRRHFVVASRERQPDIRATASAFTRPERSVDWAIGDLERASRAKVIDQTGLVSPLNRERIDYLFANKLFELPDEMRPDCHRLQVHTYKSVYGRLRPDSPAQTITSGFVSMGQGRYVHPSQKRTITPHEAARLQFIPDFFDFSSVSKRTALAEMIGNAVPSKLTYVIGVELLR